MPLVVFTVLSQLAVGGTITLWILSWKNERIKEKTGRNIAAALTSITALSLGVSVFHLGHPFEAYRALTHLSTSWLSREVLLFSLFFLSQLIYFLVWEKIPNKQRVMIGGISSILGILGIGSSSLIYKIPAIPAWDSLSPILFFYLTSALLGPLFVGFLLMLFEKEAIKTEKFTVAVVLIDALVSAMYLSVLFTGKNELAMTAQNIMSSNIFWIRGLLSWFIPLAVFVPGLVMKSKKKQRVLTIFGVFLCVLIGEILGRELFYGTAVGLQIHSLLN
ncbi:DmsC/YnfH family molybdoenzyme membrane anchor subunit [Neobacillus sp. PS3-12]|jgi:anaerobic dimethyl sulfoxide reductase subunit C|uniref:dimethyl sulfoxide reductase anchor subunit family protein n=1 Tax=Neobacillus sp. PS3-12 TaxID=3070677 RepID=UPI0027E0F911|nr:DmsC/YnfH family molybdoenzyme membrane anchor subunit [Neobacillus sp. PS3-12]WML55669.1 DmsC/YnfH family molybdoenzyme membrane anchor subunit [Neobacillus sp. PS3-12]